MNKKRARTLLPQRVSAFSRELGDETIVYDARTHRGHCLNKTAAAVWMACDGKRTVPEIVRVLQQAKPGQGIDEEIVGLAVAKLERSGLLSKGVSPSNQPWSRRKAIRTIGAVAAIALPVVTSIVVPTTAQAVSCFQIGHLCNNNAQCCSGHCGVVGINLVCS